VTVPAVTPDRHSPPTGHPPAARAAAEQQAWVSFAHVVAGRPRVRVSRDRGRSYPRSCERALGAQLPAAPAAVLLYDEAGFARCLVADFDVSHGGRGQVDTDATRFAALIEACGGRSFADQSPTGGRHVYVLWSAPVLVSELRPVMRALRVLFPSLDITPMANPTDGCIRPPGAAHPAGGHQVLTTPLDEALAAVAAPCGPQVWAALLDRLAPQLAVLAAGEPDCLAAAGGVPRPDGPAARLSARMEAIAATGTYDPASYATASEARQAVITAAVGAGWTLTDVAGRLERGHWPGLAALFARYRRPGVIRSALGRDWRKAVAFVERGKSRRQSTTRAPSHSGGIHRPPILRTRPEDLAGIYGQIRGWWTAVLAVERLRYTGPGGLSRRVVLRALGAMAQRRGSRYLDVGRRSLSLGCHLDDSTVSEVLRALREENDPLIVLIEGDRGERGDLYELRIPDAVAETARWRSWRAGRIAAIHPVFRALGAARALVYEALSSEPAPRRDVIHDAALPPRTVAEALTLLAEHGLAERVPNEGWRRGPVALDDLAEGLGVLEQVEALIAEYAVERAAWRAILGIIDPLHVHDVVHGHGAQAGADAPPWWPEGHGPPADVDDAGYDQALAETAQLADILALLHRELGAITLGTRAPEDPAGDPRYGVYAGAESGVAPQAGTGTAP
jgi:hypothetical protein